MNIKHTKYRYFFIFSLYALLVSCTTIQKPHISKAYINYINDSVSSFKDFDSQNDGAVAFFIEGAKFEQQGYHSDAIIEYLEALRLDTNAAIYYALGKNFIKIYKYERAEEYLKKAIGTDSSLYSALYELGQLYLKTYKRSEAENAFEELVRINPVPKHLFNLAYLYEFSSPAKAAEIYENLRNQNEDYQILAKLAGIYFELEDTVKYIDRLEKAHSYAADSPETTSQLMAAYIMNGKYNKASKLLKDTDYRFVSEDLEYIYQEIGSKLVQESDSMAVSLKTMYLQLLDSRFYFNWQLQSLAGFVAVQLKDTSKSELYFKKALSSADSIPEVALQLSNFYLITNKPENALHLLNEYQVKFPDDYRFPNLLGIGYFTLFDYDNSIIEFKKSLELNIDNIDACTQLGIIYDQMNNIDSSDFYYELALEIYPDDPLTNNNYAYSLSLRSKELDRALEMSKKSLLNDNNNSSYLDTYGWILFKLKRYDEALEFILKASLSEDITAEVFEHLGDIYLMLNDKKNAINAWNKGLELEPGRESIIQKLNEQQ